MATNKQEQAVLLEAPEWAEVRMAETLLAEAGIPCMQRPHNDGTVGYCAEESGIFMKPDLLVPAELLERAQAVLREAWQDRE